MKVYIAAPWKYREQAKIAALKFTLAGHKILEPWWEHRDVNGQPGFEAELCAQAVRDMYGVRDADWFVLLNLAYSEGKSVELGMALAWRVPVIAVGEPSLNIFHYLPQVKWVGSVEGALKEVGR